MADSTRPKKTRAKRDEPFYEAMPATFDHFVKAFPEAEAQERDDELLTGEKQPPVDKEGQKLTAVITILLVAFVAIVLGLLFLRGLDTIKSTVPSQSHSGSSGTLEM